MFDLLLVFLAEPGVLLTRDTLFERVWPGVVVEDSNLSQSVWMLRKALSKRRCTTYWRAPKTRPKPSRPFWRAVHRMTWPKFGKCWRITSNY
ncbi:MAG: winged helix-turn-helix domain-containing protein, partial [Rhodoferax sp.]